MVTFKDLSGVCASMSLNMSCNHQPPTTNHKSIQLCSLDAQLSCRLALLGWLALAYGGC